MKDNIKIFICTHKDFEPPVKDKAYSVVNSNDIRDLTVLPLDDGFYSELYHIKYVVDNIKLPKYIGFCHYRRYFSFLDRIPDMDEEFKISDCLVAKPIESEHTVMKMYELFHNKEDLEIIGDIIKRYYKNYCEAYQNFTNGNIMVPCNMFIMKRKDFKEYCNFVFGVLDKYLKIVGTDIDKRIEDNKEKYLKNIAIQGFEQNMTPEYQRRIGGFLGERLTNIFLMKKFKKMKIIDFIVTEKK